MNSPSKYSYKLRPGYGSKELLIDFENPESADNLQVDLFKILEEAGFQFNKTSDLWVNDEFLYEFSSSNGSIILSRDNWGLFFIIGEQNPIDILRIDEILQNHPDFRKLEVDFDKYK